MKNKFFLKVSLLGCLTLLLSVVGSVQAWADDVEWPISSATYQVNVGSQITSADDVVDGSFYIFYQPRNTACIQDNSGNLQTVKDVGISAVNGSTSVKYVFKLISNGNGTYKIQSYTGKYFPAPTGDGAMSTNATAGSYALNFNSNGYIFPRCTNSGKTYGLDRSGNSVYAYSTLSDVEGTNNGQCYQLYAVTLTEPDFAPTASEIYTIQTASRGALCYSSSNSDYYVWATGVANAAAFDASNANCQWIFYPTGTAGKYYLYNVGYQKFIVKGGTVDNHNRWAFSDDALPFSVEQGETGLIIKAADFGESLSINTGFTSCPVFNYYVKNDAGSNFTITKVADVSSTITSQLNAKVNKLVKNQTALTSTSAITSGDWYIAKITHGTYDGFYIKNQATEYNYSGTNYPLTFNSECKEQEPSMSSAIYFTRIVKNGSNYQWQMPNGKYLVYSSTKFPLSSVSAGNINIAYNSGFNFYNSGYYATAYTSSGNYFIGETTQSGTAKTYALYHVDLSTAGLTAYSVVINNGGDNTQLTCTNSKAVGLTSVYNNGYFFFPSDYTPTSADFNSTGYTDISINTSTKVITATYDPNLAIITDDIHVYQGFGTTGRGNEKAVLLRIVASPFNAMTNASMQFTLTNNEGNITGVKLYETGNTVEFNAQSSFTNTYTGTVSGSTATFTLGNVTASTHYYWLCATIASDAELYASIDAKLDSWTYTVSGQTEQNLDLSSVGNPANSMQIFPVQSYPFVPTTYSSNVYRIPALTNINVGGTNRIVAAADKRYNSSADLGSHVIDVIVHYSDDGGKTWSDPILIAKGQGDSSNPKTYGYGDPAFVIGKDGYIYCLMAAGQVGWATSGQPLEYIAAAKSADGATWYKLDGTTRLDNAATPTPTFIANATAATADGITFSDDTPDGSTVYGLYQYFVTSGKGLCTTDGTLMFLLDTNYYTTSAKSNSSVSSETNFVLYSTYDETNGYNVWHVAQGRVATGANEAKIIQLANGSLLSSTRSNYSRIFNTGTYTNNGDGTCTFTWDSQYTVSALTQNGSGNNQDVIYYPASKFDATKKDFLIHTITSNNGHNNLQLFKSTDNGATWTQFMQVQPGGSRYSVMTILENGDVGILLEDYSLETGNNYPISYFSLDKARILEEAPDADIYDVKLITSSGLPSYYGTLENSKWTSGANSGAPDGETVTMTSSNLTITETTSYWSSSNQLQVAQSGTEGSITFTAPEGYIITGYDLAVGNFSSNKSNTITCSADNNAVTVTTASSGASTLTSSSLESRNLSTLTFNITSTSSTKCDMLFSKFVISLKEVTNEEIEDVKIVYGTTANDSRNYGTLNGLNWQSKVVEGYNTFDGLSMNISGGGIGYWGVMKDFSVYDMLYYKVSAANTVETFTLSVPDGYLITGYSLLASKAQTGEYTITLTTPDGVDYDASTLQSFQEISYTLPTAATSTTLQIASSSADNYFALAQFKVNVTEDPNCVIYKVVDESSTVLASGVESVASFPATPSLPASLKRAYCTYTFYSDRACTQSVSSVSSATTVYAKCAYEGPFVFSTAEHPTWYRLSGQEQSVDLNYHISNGTSIGVTSDRKVSDKYFWAFIGNPYEVKLINKAVGTDKYFSASARSAGSNSSIISSSFVTDGDASYPYNTFSLYKYSGAISVSDAFCLALNGSSNAWLDALGGIKYHSGVVINDNQTISNWRTTNIMATCITDIEGLPLRIGNKMPNGSITSPTLTYSEANSGLTAVAYSATDLNQLMLLEPATGGKYIKLANYGKYVGKTQADNNRVPVTDDAQFVYTVTALAGGGFLLECNEPTVAAHPYIHSHDSEKVVAWTAEEDWSQWYIEPVSEWSISKSGSDAESSYASVYLPFAFSTESGEILTISGKDDNVATTAAVDALPAEEGAILKADGTGDVTFTLNVQETANVSALGEGENLLGGTLQTRDWSSEENIYVLSKLDDEVGLYLFYPESGSGTLTGNKAYLNLTDDGSEARKVKFIYFDKAPLTGVNAPMTSEKTSSAPVYDLQGRRVLQPQRGGVYITGGKKVLK